MKNALTLIIDETPHPHRTWARAGIPEGFPRAESLEACTTDFVSFLPGASRVDGAFLENACRWLERYPEVNVMLGKSMVRFDQRSHDRIRNLGGLVDSRYLDPGNFGREIVMTDCPLLFGWEGIVFRTEALRTPGIRALQGNAFFEWLTVMVLGLQSGVLLENRRVAVRLEDEEGASDEGLLEEMPGLLREVKASAVAAADALEDDCTPLEWAEQVMNRLIEDAVSKANGHFKAARDQLRAADPGARLWLGITGLLRRRMEQRLRQQYERHKG